MKNRAPDLGTANLRALDWYDQHPIRRFRDAKGMSTAALAGAIGCSPSSVADWERGAGKRTFERQEPLPVIEKLCRMMGINPARLSEQIRQWRELGTKIGEE